MAQAKQLWKFSYYKCRSSLRKKFGDQRQKSGYIDQHLTEVSTYQKQYMYSCAAIVLPPRRNGRGLDIAYVPALVRSSFLSLFGASVWWGGVRFWFFVCTNPAKYNDEETLDRPRIFLNLVDADMAHLCGESLFFCFNIVGGSEYALLAKLLPPRQQKGIRTEKASFDAIRFSSSGFTWIQDFVTRHGSLQPQSLCMEILMKMTSKFEISGWVQLPFICKLRDFLVIMFKWYLFTAHIS